MAIGGFFQFKPTDNSTRYVRAAFEGTINGIYDVNVEDMQAIDGKTAGRFATIKADGTVGLASAKGVNAVGLIREDLVDMAHASGKASFYFIGGEYHVAASRLGDDMENFTVGGGITTNANGQIVPATDGDTVLGIVCSKGQFRMGNMYEWANTKDADNFYTDSDEYLGFIMKI